ncbi:RNA-binding protein YlmH [Peptoniphilus koenoeneniae]|uniref:RNA-binding protein YlmH n=1 Tax=Peptoniphilus koenoeneniae TaxID=507751 RepID=A0ABU0AS68_9FIRM|nr:MULTISPECIES: YlmH/Sll1252 family protein [Peptoniphilus]ERT56780.1 S4 domain protein [Peptoniphilus sp. BV3C26]MDQ0274109.1 RNA-binding protein YlmH [Peptoniphilus koenoeneniae]
MVEEISLDFIKDLEIKNKLKRVVDKIQICLKSHEPVSTDFLDPYERQIAISFIKKYPLSYKIDGGCFDAERSILIIFPDYLEYEGNLTYKIRIDYKGNLKHKDILGAILSQGFSRNKLGDIYVYNDYSYVIAAKEIANYLVYNLQKVANISVRVSLIDDVLKIDKQFTDFNIILSSKRLDNFISQVFKIRRNLAKELVEKNMVKVNFQLVDKSSFFLNEGDLISVRRYGRAYLNQILKETKKGNLLVNIKIPQ